MEEKVELLVEDIKMLDEKGEEGTLTEEEVGIHKGKLVELWRLLEAKDALIAQRSRSRWLKEGDANSKFFHKCIKLMKSINSIKALKENEGWVVSPFEVRRKAVNYFTNHFAEDRWDRPRLDEVDFENLIEVENGLFVAPFSLLEIEEAVRDSDGGTTPGPDGYNFAFN